MIQVGAPKNVKRLVQRIGRANHRYNAPSKALVVPANRFEVVECVAASRGGEAKTTLDGEPRGPGPRDVLCASIYSFAPPVPAPSMPTRSLQRGAARSGAYAGPEPGATFDRLSRLFAPTGGYALRAYDRWQRLMQRCGRAAGTCATHAGPPS